MKNKICMVTGATAGIGYVTALELARQEAEVILVGRNPIRIQQSVEKIRQVISGAKISFLLADLSSQTQIHQLAEVFKTEYIRLDVLVNNAGGYFLKRQLSVDGIEMTFALNHLSYYLLTHLLMDCLEASKAARVVNVSSNAHKKQLLNFEDLQSVQRYNGLKAYGRSKLANILFTYELDRRLEATAIKVNALHPGLVSTNIGNNNGWLVSKIWSYITRNGLTPEEGARTNIFLASAPEVEGVTGKYFVREKDVPSSDASYDLESARHLWEISKQMVTL